MAAFSIHRPISIPGTVDNISTFYHVTYRQVIAAADVDNGTVVTCTMTFIQLEWKDESALRTTPLPDLPDYLYVWSTKPIRVVSNITGSYCFAESRTRI